MGQGADARDNGSRAQRRGTHGLSGRSVAKRSDQKRAIFQKQRMAIR